MSQAVNVLPASRKDAIATGAIHYFTGKPCKRGHVASRWASGGHCAECEREYKNSPEYRKHLREYQKSPKMREYQREWDKAPERRKYMLEFSQRRDASKRNATPSWLTSAHIDSMRAVYAEAARLTRETGIPHHVDHIVPLTHPDVQGLHCPWNLQVLPALENLSKGNAFDGTHENESWRRQ